MHQSLHFFGVFTQAELLNYLISWGPSAHNVGSILIRCATLEYTTPHKAHRSLCFLGLPLINNPDKSAHYYELNQHNCMCHTISRSRGDMRQSLQLFAQEAD